VSWKSTSTTNPALLLRAQIPRSNVGQVAHVSQTPWVTSQEANITRCTPEAAYWLWLGCWSNKVANSHPLAMVFSTAEYCAPVWCRSAHTRLFTLPATTSCELWLDACVLHQRTTFQSSQASKLLSFVAVEPHYLYDAVPWSLNICSIQRSPVHRLRTHILHHHLPRISTIFILLRLNPLGQRKHPIVISLSRMLCFGRVCASPCALNVSAALQGAYKSSLLRNSPPQS